MRVVVDPAAPNLLREDFPYSRIPPIRFEGDGVPQALPRKIWITDTTFRDGQQARAPYTVEQIVHLYDLLAELTRVTTLEPPAPSRGSRGSSSPPERSGGG